MRTLPLIERVLLVGVAVLIAALLVFLMAWHLRWNALQRSIAAIVPRPGVVLAPAQPNDAELWADFVAWGTRAQERGDFHPEGFFIDSGQSFDGWIMGDVMPPPESAGHLHVAHDALLRELEGMLARGLRPSLAPDFQSRMEDDQAQRQFVLAGEAWACSARMDGDPTTAVADAGAPVRGAGAGG